MHSSVNWALLGLIIERPSYAYELARRFERTYGDALSLSSTSHAYVALGKLKDRGLVEELPGTRTGRQPKPHYRATARAGGLSPVVDRAGREERRRQRVFLLALALARDPDRAMQIVEDYEQACLGETYDRDLERDGALRGALELQARLIAEERRLAVGAKIAWARYARSGSGRSPPPGPAGGRPIHEPAGASGRPSAAPTAGASG
jgi:hypothetical protein